MSTNEVVKVRRWGKLRAISALLGMVALMVLAVHAGETVRAPVVVKIQDEQAKVVESGGTGPLDPVQRIRFMGQPQLNVNISNEQGQNLHLSHFPGLNIDGQFINLLNNGGGGRFEMVNAKLPKGPSGKDRVGFMSVYIHGDLRLTQTLELTPTKAPAPGQKRRLDSVMVRYLLENKGKQAHKIGLRLHGRLYRGQ